MTTQIRFLVWPSIISSLLASLVLSVALSAVAPQGQGINSQAQLEAILRDALQRCRQEAGGVGLYVLDNGELQCYR